MTDLLFDVPWWIQTILIVIGAALALSGNRRQNDRTRNGGIALIGLAIAWSVMSYLVDTPKEKCQRQTRQFVQSVVDRDWTTFHVLLDADVRFAFHGSQWQIDGRDTLEEDVKKDVESIGLKSVHITNMKTSEDGSAITITIAVLSTQSSTLDRPLDSDWEMEWHRSAGKWLLHDIRAVQVANLSPDQIRSSLPGR
jgi:hypothetical protein